MATQQRSPSLFDPLTSAQQLWPGVISGAVPAHLVLTQLHTTQVSHEGAVLYNRLMNVITSRWQVYVKVMYRVLPSRTHTHNWYNKQGATVIAFSLPVVVYIANLWSNC